ncbi:hypothetical protein SO802_003575, partial [Lithocarpus litseifolius]
VIAKGEAQGMVSKFIGIMLGIGLANNIGSSTSLALASFSVVTWIHMFCNLKSYQSIQLRTLNSYRVQFIVGEERSIHELKLFFFQTLFEWENASGVVNFISLPDMMDFCTSIPV